jgi:cytochrome c oxidase subunit 1
MILFSTSYHLAGLRGLPRRVYSASLAGDQGAAWHDLTVLAAIGGVVLFASALSYVSVVVATWVAGRRITAPAFEFAEPLRPEAGVTIWDRFGLWSALAAALVVVAYAYPLYLLLSQTRYGSPGYQPF